MKAAERADVLRRIAELDPRARRGVHRARGPRHRHADLADARPCRARRAELRLLRGRDRGAARPRLPGGRRVPQLHGTQAGRRRRADHALERPADALDLADRAGARRRATRSSSSRPSGRRSPRRCSRACSSEAELPPGVFNVVHGFGETAGAPLVAHPGVDLVCFTGETTTGRRSSPRGAPTLKRSSVELGGKSPVVVFEDADPDLARRRRARADLHAERPALHRRLAPARPGAALRAIVEAVAERARNIRVGDPFDAAHRARPADPPRAPRARARATSSRRASRARRVLAGGERPERARDGQLPRGDRDRRRRRDDARLPGGDLRAGARRDAVRRRGGGGPARERDPVRARRLRLDERHPARAPRRAGDRHRHVLDQLAERPRPADAVRRRQAQRASAARAATTRSTSTARLEIVHVALGTHHIPRLGPRADEASSRLADRADPRSRRSHAAVRHRPRRLRRSSSSPTSPPRTHFYVDLLGSRG